jgi:Na+-translocating ferredoxin:NAD+ oxidoreductase RnfD subunit
MSVRRFFKTPKGLLTIVLAILAAIAASHEGMRVVAPGLLSAIVVAAALDVLILRTRHPRWEFPSGAILTGLIVAMVLSAQTPWTVVALTSALAIVSKYVVRTRAGNVFNPAALAIVATFPVFHAGQSWWGALPEVMPIAQVALVVGGVFIADRVNKMPLVLAFLATYYLLFTVTSFVSDPAWVSEVFRTPDLPPGTFTVTTAVHDTKGKRSSVVETTVEVPGATAPVVGSLFIVASGVILREAMRHQCRPSRIS